MFKNISIRFKIIFNLLFSLLALTVILMLAIFLVENYIENQYAGDNIKSAQYTIQKKLEYLLKINKDYADWDEMRKFIKTKDPKWIKKNVTDWVPNHFGIDLIAVTDMSGNILYQYGDFPEYTGNIANNPLVKRGLNYKDVTGIYTTSKGLAFVAAAPIESSLDKLPQNGVYIYGDLIDDSLVKEVHEATGFGSSLYGGDKLIATTLATEEPYSLSAAAVVYNEKKVAISKGLLSMSIYFPIIDLNGEPVAALEIIRDRTAFLSSIAGITLTSIFGFILMAFVGLRFAGTIAFRLGRLEKVSSIIQKGEIPEPLDILAEDEIGNLVKSFNKMCRELKESRQKVLEYNMKLEEVRARRIGDIETERGSLEEKVSERTRELEEKLAELEEFRKVVVGRELKMIELEKEVNSLLAEVGREQKYK